MSEYDYTPMEAVTFSLFHVHSKSVQVSPQWNKAKNALSSSTRFLSD
jgi:hypothetical protein